MDDCIFCRIIHKQNSSFNIWEDTDHLAFLSIYPNTKGATVVIPKQHYDSYAFDLPDSALCNLILASKKVAKLIDSKLPGVGRTALVFEGFGINHVHAKLFPLHGTATTPWKPIKSNIKKYFDIYEGYVSSHDADRINDKDLESLAKFIKA